MPSLDAVLWDMDGTLVDTEPSWIAAEHAIVEEHGGTWNDELATQLVGHDLLVSARFIIENSSVTWTPERVVDELISRVVADLHGHVPWRPGALDLLGALRERGVRTALVTMSYAALLPPVLTALGDLAFDAIVTGDSVTRGKPHPEPYLTAVVRLGFPAAECLVIEDSLHGITSAREAGCHTLAITTSYGAEALTAAGAETVCSSYAEIAAYVLGT